MRPTLPRRPSRREVIRRWLTGPIFLVVVTGLTVSGIWAFFTLVPVPNHVSESFTIPGVSGQGSGCGSSPNFSAPSPGRLSFSWTSNATNWVLLTLFQAAPNVPQPFARSAQPGPGGVGNVSISPGLEYFFAFCGEWNQTATVSGALTYATPLL